MNEDESPINNLNLPNTLTLLRILATPIAIVFYLNESMGVAFIIFLLASLTDYFDGKIARRLKQCTPLGSLLDPVADKVFEMSFTLAMGFFGDLPWYYVLLLNLRNLAQLLAIPILLWWKKISFKVEPSMIAKWGSALGMIVIGSVLLNHLINAEALVAALGLLIIVSAAFEMYMLITYLPRFWLVYKREHDTFN